MSQPKTLLNEEFLRNCETYKKIEKENNEASKEIKRVLNICKKAQFKYGKSRITLLEMLKIIKLENKSKNVNDFLDLFPETIGIKGIPTTRSHIFEALWIVIFVLRLDDLFPNNGTRIFYNSVERNKEILRFIGTNNDGIKKFFKDSSVNESNKSGIVDIYFEDINKQLRDNVNFGYACENKCKTTKKDETKKKDETTAYFYSSKYFNDDSKRSISSLDIEKIFTEVMIKLSKEGRPPYKIGVLVNDIDVILKKQQRSYKAAAELLNSNISYGTGNLNIYYKRLLDYLQICDLESDNPFSESSSFPEKIRPRFHQELFINFTNNRINKGNNKFIWGAVPRSGKSFMIGGLIAKRQPRCVLLILGAVSETHDQFRKDVFEKYNGSFGEYNIIDVKDKKDVSKFSSIDSSKKNIIIVSQQQLWQKSDDNSLRDYPDLNNALSTSDKLIFFDEIHQGASSNADAQQKILDKYVANQGVSLTFPFIMVTATFIKPMLKYNTLGNEKSIILQWTYDMMQNMKTIASEDTQQLIIEEIKADRDNDNGREKGELFKKLLDDYQKSGYTLIQLQEQYEKEPELSIICPALTEPNKSLPEWTHNDTNMRDIFNIKKVESGQSQGLSQLLKYIKKSVYGIRNPKAILAENNFNVLTRQHSQLWFLPTKLTNTKSEEGEVEPMMRYLLSEVMKDKFFRDNFCFVLMHSKNVSTKKKEYRSILSHDLSGLDETHKENLKETIKESGDKICFSTFCLSPNKGSKLGDKECLREEECEAYNKKKSLIIFTGAKLRLGISLPCVDIAIHMDPIKSVDTIYQSMFRVLTPYPGKTKGFFIDLLKNRLIEFFYQYENQLNYNNSNNLPETKLKRLRNLIFSHDLNGIILKQNNNTEYVKEYTELIKKLGLENINTFQQKSEKFKINNETASTLINSVFNDNQIIDFYKKFTLSKNKTSKHKKIITILRRGDGLLDTKERDTSKKSGKKEVSLKEKRDAVTIYFLNLIALFILFEDNNDDNCNERDVRSGIEKIMNVENIPSTDDIRELCNISEGENNMLLLCYLSQTVLDGINENELQVITNEEKNFLLSELVKELNDKLDTFKIMIHNIQLNNMSELINIYCNIKNSFLMIKKDFNPNNLDKKPCSIDFIKNEKILKIIRERLNVRTSEKEQHGEVFTPPELVCEMLDTLPDSVWEDKGLTWLDPANGIGNFPVIAYYKLMDGLKKAIPKDKERSKHIIEKMLYMVELNPINVKVSKKIFKMIDPHAEPNIVKANFLTEASKWKRAMGRDTFDIIMGNPPYQYKKPGNKKSQAIWPDFVESSINCLKENGYLVFIHPNNWRNIDGEYKKIFNLIQERDLQHLTMRTFEDGAKTFGGSGTNFDYYCLKNTLTTKNKTKINDIDRIKVDLDLNNYNFIPSGRFNIFEKLIKGDQKVNIVYDRTMYGNDKPWMNKDNTGKYIYPIVYTITQKDGIKLWYSSVKKDMFIPKVMISNGLGTYPIIDSKGEYGLSNFSYGIQDIPKNLEYIKNALNDPEFIELMEYVRFLNTKYNYKIIGAFKKDFWKEFDYKSKPSKTLKKKSPSTSHSKTRKSPPETKPKSTSPSPSRTLKAKTHTPTKKKTRKKGKKLKIKTAQ